MLAGLAALFLAASLILETAVTGQIPLGRVLAVAGLAFLIAAVLAPYRPRPPEVPVSRARWLAPAVVAVVAVACVLWWPQIRNEFFVIVGNRDEPGGWYGWWSGNAGGLQIIEWAAIGALIWWHHQCGVHSCYWYARRTTAAGERACWKHHPHPKRTAEDVHAAHHAAVKSRAQ